MKMEKCDYRDGAGRPAKDCLGGFVRKNNSQKNCKVCARHAINASNKSYKARKAQSRPQVKVRMKRCEFQGGAGLEERFRPPKPCLGWFEVNPNSGQKFCGVCRPFAYKYRDHVQYWKNPRKFRKQMRDRNRKKAEAADLDYHPLTGMRPCEYRDKYGRRGVGCIRRFKPKNGRQRYCRVCKRLAALDANRRWAKSPAGRVKIKDQFKGLKAKLAQADAVLKSRGGRRKIRKLETRIVSEIKAQSPRALLFLEAVASAPGPRASERWRNYLTEKSFTDLEIEAYLGSPWPNLGVARAELALAIRFVAAQEKKKFLVAPGDKKSFCITPDAVEAHWKRNKPRRA